MKFCLGKITIILLPLPFNPRMKIILSLVISLKDSIIIVVCSFRRFDMTTRNKLLRVSLDKI